ncbi:APC family permease [Chitinophagaceae bacterium LB-8]|uniref:APC family permease n=1 Tax=Paraflavisolibacter caeni TaxID=2982496 RepID=A0A9X3B999_9BACT|nr:APC family permease [Paraflavisolibacter caeni]MCU7550881.1 APC family permease [Paraflavisolibacter caeni]
MKKHINKLRRVLGVAFGIAVVVGGTIGVGILRAPSTIAAVLPSAPMILLCWILVGIYILLSASSYAELTTMLPKAGGAYNYIKRAFGGYAGFLNGWFDFICNAIAPAYFCIVLSEYTTLIFPGIKPYTTLVAILFLSFFTLFNLPGVKSGSSIQQVTSAAKVLLFLVLIGGCFFSEHTTTIQSINTPLLSGGMFIAVFKSLQLIMGSYDGWMSVSFFAEEDQDPGHNIPKSYMIGALTVMLLYVLVNAAILYVLPVSAIANSTLAASDAASVAFGRWSKNLIIMIALFSLFSILNAYMMIPSRILFGLSRDGYFIKQGTILNKGGTPYISLLFCYTIATTMILLSSFEQLFALGAFMMTMVTGFAFLSLIYLRKKEPTLHRPYKAWGYPFSTYFAFIVTIALFIGFAISDQFSFLVILSLIIFSYPFYNLFIRKRNKLATQLQ